MTADAKRAIYAVLDRRHNGLPRIVGEFVDPDAAHKAAQLLAWAGDGGVEVVLLSTVDANETAP